MKKTALLLGIMTIIFAGCDNLNVTTLTVDGAVIYQESASKLSGAYGVFVVAKANIDFYDRNAMPEITPPQPDSDTLNAFGKIDLPSFLTPENGAQVVVNGTALNEIYDGQYQGSLENIHPGDSIFIDVSTQDGDTGKAKMVMPGAFNLSLNDTTIPYDSLDSIDFTWTKSAHANAYMVLMYYVDSLNNVSLKIKETTRDTTFSISHNELSQGNYLLQVAAVYGKLNASMPQEGSLLGVVGQVATLYIKKPVIITIR